MRLNSRASQRLANGGATSEWHTVSETAYDALGKVKTKKLAPEYNNDAGLETLDYDYNIGGWLLGANRYYISATATPNDKHFGFDLGYDKKGTLDYDNLWKITSGRYVSEALKKAIQKEKLTGVDFEKTSVFWITKHRKFGTLLFTSYPYSSKGVLFGKLPKGWERHPLPCPKNVYRQQVKKPKDNQRPHRYQSGIVPFATHLFDVFIQVLPMLFGDNPFVLIREFCFYRSKTFLQHFYCR